MGSRREPWWARAAEFGAVVGVMVVALVVTGDSKTVWPLSAVALAALGRGTRAPR
jgi:hypothetical protein